MCRRCERQQWIRWRLCGPNSWLDLNRHPEFYAAEPGSSVDLLAVTLQRSAIGGLVPGVRQALVPDDLPRGAYGRDVIPMLPNGVRLRSDSQPRELGRMGRELRDLNAADVLIVAGIFGVADDPITGATDL